MKVIATISRVLVGLLFIFSGFVKANDPLGFSYKLDEYYHVFGLGFLTSSSLYQAMLISVMEMVLGFAVLMGTRMKVTGSLILAMIIFFTMLTGYTAISNWFFENPDNGTTQWFANLFGFAPKNIYYMTDCGCFGEFIKLTPWQSFTKDLILLALIIIIFIRRKQTRSLFSRSIQTNIIVSFSVLFTVFTVYCDMFLPMVNFLNWKDGNNVGEMMVCPPDAPKDSVQNTFTYKYKDNGNLIEISYEDLMANKIPPGTEWVKTNSKVITKGCQPQIVGFTMFTADNTDYKDTMLQNNDYQLLVISYDLEHARKHGMKKVSELAKEFIEKDGKKVWGLTASTLEDAEKVRHEHGLIFDFYNTDAKMLKSMIRSNAGLILMKGPVVIESWPARNIPSAEKVRKIMAKNK